MDGLNPLGLSRWFFLAGSRHVVVSKASLFDCSFGLLGKDLRFGYPDGFKILLPGEVRDVKSKTAEKLTDNCWSSSLEAILYHGGMRLREIQGAVEINTVFFVILRLFVNFWFSNFTKQVRGQYFLRTIGSFLIQTGGEVQAQRCACLGLIIWREPAGSAAKIFPYQACDASLHLVPNKPVVLVWLHQHLKLFLRILLRNVLLMRKFRSASISQW